MQYSPKKSFNYSHLSPFALQHSLPPSYLYSRFRSQAWVKERDNGPHEQALRTKPSFQQAISSIYSMRFHGLATGSSGNSSNKKQSSTSIFNKNSPSTVVPRLFSVIATRVPSVGQSSLALFLPLAKIYCLCSYHHARDPSVSRFTNAWKTKPGIFFRPAGSPRVPIKSN